MNIFRRTFLKLFGGAVAAAALVKIDAAKAFFQEGDLRPCWCPKGFLPVQGQTLTIEKYPDLFLKMEIDGKNYYPPYYGKLEAKLDSDVPYVATEFEIAGLWFPGDRLTLLPPKHAGWDDVEVKLIATEHMRWSNGRPIRAGFISAMPVSKKIFEQTYGKIDISNKHRIMSYNGYEPHDYTRSMP